MRHLPGHGLSTLWKIMMRQSTFHHVLQKFERITDTGGRRITADGYVRITADST